MCNDELCEGTAEYSKTASFNLIGDPRGNTEKSLKLAIVEGYRPYVIESYRVSAPMEDRKVIAKFADFARQRI